MPANESLIKWGLPLGLFLGVLLLVAMTSSDYGLTWDEPGYFHASDLEIQWLSDFGKNLFKGQPGGSLGDDVIIAAWHWDTYHVPHPPFSRILSGLTKELFFRHMDKFSSYRLAPALFFALLVTVMYLWMAELFDRTTGLLSALTLVLIPNLFGFAHFAVTDMSLTALWFLTVYCFWRGLKDWRWSLGLGVVWGLALSTKFPALVIPIPLLLWAHLYHRRSYHNNVFSMAFLSPVVMIISQPYLWHRTFLRILEFLYEGLSRSYRPETNYMIFFYNKIYATSTLPWYYPFFETAVTTPETILLLSLVGVIALVRPNLHRPVMILFLLNTFTILGMGLLPGAVLHDGMRQLLSLLPFLAGLAGWGFVVLRSTLMEWSQKIAYLQHLPHLQQKLIGILYTLVLFPLTLDLFVYHPFELSYYNRLVGGIRGAYERGLEVTYFMEAFTPDFLDLLNRSLPQNAIINATFCNVMLEYYQKENRLRPDFVITDKKADYYILLNRQSTLGESTLRFLKTVPPDEALRLDGVPLISIYKVKGSIPEGKRK